MKKSLVESNAMNRPYVVCHMLTSLDGKIDGSFFSVPETQPSLAEYGRIRSSYDCPAVLYGTTTMVGGYSDGLAGTLPKSAVHIAKEDYIASSDVKNYIVSVDPKGILGWNCAYIEKKGRPRAHVIEVLTEMASEDYLAYLQKLDISYIFAGKEQLDCSQLLNKLYTLFSIERLMVAGGGLMNWSFVQQGLLDELSLVIAPTADGSTTAVSIVERADFLPAKGPVAFTLKEVQQLRGDGLWLRYLMKR